MHGTQDCVSEALLKQRASIVRQESMAQQGYALLSRVVNIRMKPGNKLQRVCREL